MKSKAVSLLLFVLAAGVHADYAGQTNWTGGGGFPGPVLNWTNRFDQSVGIEWEVLPGAIILQYFAEKHNVSSFFPGAYSVFTEDIDGDGDRDVLGAGFSSYMISWWENQDGSGTSWDVHVVDNNYPGARCVHADDMDGDGDIDILGAANEADDITCWLNSDGSGTSWDEYTLEGDFSEANSVSSADIDGDGDMDVLGTANVDGIARWENSDTSPGMSWTMHPVDDQISGVRCGHSGDLDGDGDLDVLGAVYSGDNIIWWENSNGSGTSWTEHLVDDDFEWAVCIRSDDLDSDGDQDIIGSGHGLVWWENTDGSGTSWMKHVISDDSSIYSLYSKDMNDDGFLDVLATNYSVVCWWGNMDGMGTDWIRHVAGTDFWVARSVYADDINGDGRQDALGAASADTHQIAWWNLAGYTATGSLESSILDTQMDPDWDYIEWNTQLPAQTSVSFQVRASDIYTAMGAWSDTLTSPCLLTGHIEDGARYLQYRAILESANSLMTPVLQYVILTWDPLGIEGGETPTAAVLLSFTPNPSSIPSVAFGVPEPSLVELTVFDLAGRRVREFPANIYATGYHNHLLIDLSPGVYFCRMVSGDYTATQHFVVIE